MLCSVQVVREVVVEAGPDVPVDRLEFDEHQRQPVDEAHEVRPAVVVGHPQPLDLQFADGQEPVVASGRPLPKSMTRARASCVWPSASRHSTGTPSRMKP